VRRGWRRRTASCYAASHHLARGDRLAAQKCAEEGIALAEAFGFPSLSALAIAYHGAALIAQGRYEQGIAGMRRSISALRATGGTPRTRDLCVLAFGLGKSDGLRKDFRC
jgi:hypothetical protein